MSYTGTNSKLNLDTDVLNQKNYNNNQAFTDSFYMDGIMLVKDQTQKRCSIRRLYRTLNLL